MIETKPRIHYVLRNAVPCIERDPIAWAFWMETGDPHVDRTEIGRHCHVVTYLRAIEVDDPGTTHEFFETRVFGGPLDGRTRRYETLGDAKTGHWELVDLSRKRMTLGERLRRLARMSRADRRQAGTVPLPMSGY